MEITSALTAEFKELPLNPAPTIKSLDGSGNTRKALEYAPGALVLNFVQLFDDPRFLFVKTSPLPAKLTITVPDPPPAELHTT